MEKSYKRSTIRVAIHQPGYHRYCGYFYKMYKSDLFISLDTVQYVAREWQNRQVFCNRGKYKWLSVPVKKGREPIKDKEIVNHKVLIDHWEYLKSIYRKCPYFNTYSPLVMPIYLNKKWSKLNDLCDALILLAKEILGIKTKYVRDSSNGYVGNDFKKADVLVDSIKRAIDVSSYDRVIYLPRSYPIPPDFYLNKKFGTNRLTEAEKIESAGINIQTYSFHPPTYKQFQNPDGADFIPNLSIFDLIFNCGENSLNTLVGGGSHGYRN